MKGLVSGLRPDLTPAQLIGTGFAAIPLLLVLFGVDLDPERDRALTGLALLAGALFASDAAIRVGRNVAAAQTEKTAAAALKHSGHGFTVTTGQGGQSGPRELPLSQAELEAVHHRDAVTDPEVEALDHRDLPDDRTEFAKPPASGPFPGGSQRA